MYVAVLLDGCAALDRGLCADRVNAGKGGGQCIWVFYLEFSFFL